jgi:hypothetical protein
VAFGMAERAAARGVGDWVDVTLRDGREFFGQVIEETDFKLVLNVRQGAITAKMTLPRSDIREVKLQKNSVESAIPATGKAPTRPADEEEGEPLSTAAPGTGGYVVVPIEGVFGEELTAGLVRAALQRCVDARAEAAILELRSPGGMVSELDKIREVIDSFEGRLRVVMYVPDEAFSAAALLCMSSREFYVGPGARVGAAVAFQESSTGSKEVDAKYNSAFAARWRALTEKAGRPGLLVDAMVVLEREVYADTRKTPWSLTSRKPLDDSERIELLDSPSTILTLTERQAVGCGAADGTAATAREVAAVLKLEHPNRRAIDGEAFARAYRTSYERNMQLVRRAVEEYNDTSEVLGDQKSVRRLEQRLREMRGTLQRIIVLYRRFDYVDNYFVTRGQSLEDLDRMLRRINEALREL